MFDDSIYMCLYAAGCVCVRMCKMTTMLNRRIIMSINIIQLTTNNTHSAHTTTTTTKAFGVGDKNGYNDNGFWRWQRQCFFVVGVFSFHTNVNINRRLYLVAFGERVTHSTNRRVQALLLIAQIALIRTWIHITNSTIVLRLLTVSYNQYTHISQYGLLLLLIWH